MARITSFLDPFADPTDGGFQAIRGMYALATGGLWGVGLGNSAMKWNLLPHAESDYIFAIIGEELGFLGCLVVVTLYGVLAYAGFRIARRSADRFIQLASVAITVWLIGQAAMNMGYVVGLLPVTGVQLPLISAGGTSLVLTLFIVGLLARFARSEPAAIEASATHPRGRLARIFLPVPAVAVDPVRPRHRPENRPPARSVVGGGRTVVRSPPGAPVPARGRSARRRRAAPPAARERPARPSAGQAPRPPPAGSRRRRARPAARGRGDPTSSRPLSVVLAGGGTGGHIEPMLALADALRRRGDVDVRITCLGTARGMETRLVPARGLRPAADPAGAAAAQAHARPAPRARSGAPLRGRDPGRCSTRWARTSSSASAATWRCRPTWPPAGHGYRSSCTSRTRCPASPTAWGRGSPPASAVTVPGTPLRHGEHVGMPLRTAISTLDRAARRAEARAEFGLDADRPTLLVFGGSQGAAIAEPRGGRRRRRAHRGRACRCCTPGGPRTPT